MPTYSNNLPLIPTEYLPIDYRHDNQFALSQLQQAATNTAKIKSRYEDLLGLELTTNKSKDTLSSYMKEAEKKLQSISGLNMMVGSNASEALNILKPVTDINGEYSFIMGDHAVTQKFKEIQQQIEESKTKDKGVNYNPAVEKITNAQLSLFSKSNDPSQWKKFYYNAENYTPAYDVQEEISKHEKDFRELIGDGNTIDNALGNGYKQSVQDKSIYATEFRNYLNTHLSDKAKNQMSLDKKAEYWNNLSSIYSIDDPKIKEQRLTQLKNTYLQAYQNETNSQLEEINKQKNTLSAFASIISPKNTELLETYHNQINKLTDYEKQIKQRGLPQSEIDLLTDVNNWQTGQDLFAQKYTDNEITKIAESASHNKISQKLETDQAFWNLKNLEKEYAQLEETKRYHNIEALSKAKEIELREAELNLKYQDGHYVNNTSTGIKTLSLSGGTEISSPEEMAEKIYNDRKNQIIENSGTAELINKVIGGTSLTRDAQNPTTSQVLFYKKYGNSSKAKKIAEAAGVKPEDTIAVAAKKIGGWVTDEHALDVYTAGNNGDPEIMTPLREIKASLSVANSAAKNLQSDLQQAIEIEAKNIVGADGRKFTQDYDIKGITSLEDLKRYLTTFHKVHGENKKFNSPLNGVMSYQDNAIKNYYNSNKEDSYSKILRAFNDLNPASKAIGYEEVNTRNTNEALKGYQSNYNNSIVDVAENANSNIEFANLVKNHPHLIINTFKGPKGYGVEFKSNASAEEKKSFLADYNLMAEKENLPVLSTTDSYKTEDAFAEAVKNLNSKNLRFKSSKFKEDASEYQIDPLNRMMLENSHSIESLNIPVNKAKSLYKLPSSITDDIVVRAINRSKESGEENLDLDLEINYPIVQWDDKGRLLKTKTGDPVVKMQNADNFIKSQFGVNNFNKETQVAFARNMTSYLKGASLKAQSNLDLIAFLKTHPEINNILDKPAQSTQTVAEIFGLLQK